MVDTETATPTAQETQAKSAAKDRAPRPKTGKGSGRGGARAGAGRPNAAAGRAKENEQLVQALTAMLAIPSIPAAMTGQEWVAKHFTTSAPAFAGQLVAVSETNPGLRKILVNAMKGDTYAVLLIGAFGYAVPPVIYYLTDDRAPIRQLLGVPARRIHVPEPPIAAGPINGTSPMASSQPA